MDAANWTVALRDKVSASASRASRSVDRLKKSLVGATRSSVNLGTSTRATGVSFSRLEASTSRSVSGFSRLTTGMVKATAAYLSFRAAIGATSGLMSASNDVDHLEFSLGKLTGDSGYDQLARVSNLATDLGLNAKKAAEGYSSLLKMQFTQDESKTWLKLSADLQALGNSADDVQGVFTAISQIKSKGRLQGDELLQLAERGVSQKLIGEEIAKSMGVSVLDVTKLKEQGKVTAEVALDAIQSSIMRQLKTTRPGEAAEEFVNTTFSGASAKVSAKLSLLRLSIGRSFTAGMSAVDGESPIDSLLKAMNDPGTRESIDQIVSSLGSLFAAVSKLAIAFGEGFFAGFGQTIGESDGKLGSFSETLVKLAPLFKVVGAAAGILAAGVDIIGAAFAAAFDPGTYTVIGLGIRDGIGSAWDWVKAKATEFWDWFNNFGRRFNEVGDSIIDGIITGLKNGWSSLIKTIQDLGSDALLALKNVLGIGSPSKEFAYLGEMSAEGYSGGWQDNVRTPELPSMPDAPAKTDWDRSLAPDNVPLTYTIADNVEPMFDVNRSVSVPDVNINPDSSREFWSTGTESFAGGLSSIKLAPELPGMPDAPETHANRWDRAPLGIASGATALPTNYSERIETHTREIIERDSQSPAPAINIDMNEPSASVVPTSGLGNSDSNRSINVGDITINVTTPSGDSEEVGKSVFKEFEAQFGAMMGRMATEVSV